MLSPVACCLARWEFGLVLGPPIPFPGRGLVGFLLKWSLRAAPGAGGGFFDESGFFEGGEEGILSLGCAAVFLEVGLVRFRGHLCLDGAEGFADDADPRVKSVKSSQIVARILFI